jgi:hypothetical protein
MEIFKKGQTVTRRQGGNASDFNKGELNIMGTSADKYNGRTVFEIEGTVKLITFEHNKEVYGAYLLSKDGVNVGYVYNTYLTKVEVLQHEELLMKYKEQYPFIESYWDEDGENIYYHSEYDMIKHLVFRTRDEVVLANAIYLNMNEGNGIDEFRQILKFTFKIIGVNSEWF